MGQNAAETVNEISELRDDLEEKLEDLEQRLPAAVVWAKRMVGLAVGGGVTGSVFWFTARRIRRRSNADAGQPVIDASHAIGNGQTAGLGLAGSDLVSAVSDGLKDGRWKPWAAGALVLWSAVRLAELRQLRKTNRMLIASRS